jgi:hypothetical protein
LKNKYSKKIIVEKNILKEEKIFKTSRFKKWITKFILLENENM